MHDKPQPSHYLHRVNMDLRFEFATASRIIFGRGVLREAGPFSKSFGTRALIVTGRQAERAAPLLDALRHHAVDAVTFSVGGEPDIITVEAGTRLAHAEKCDLVIGCGGGSVLDAGKAIAAMRTNPGELLDYLEVVGRGKELTRPSAPFIAIPTTAGTGTEVTRNAVLASPSHRVKVSLRSLHLLPRIALIDPELTYDLPAPLTASTGLDALTQLIEPFVSLRANPLTNALCVDGMRRAARSLRRAVADGHDVAAREDMAAASLFSGFALANAGLGAVHGFAGPIGGMFPAPHGAVCAALLPAVMDANLRALRQRFPASRSLPQYDEAARILTGNPAATAEAGVEWLQQLVTDLQVPRLRAYGITRAHTVDLVEKAAKASSMKANPISLTLEELAEILARAL